MPEAKHRAGFSEVSQRRGGGKALRIVSVLALTLSLAAGMLLLADLSEAEAASSLTGAIYTDAGGSVDAEQCSTTGYEYNFTVVGPFSYFPQFYAGPVFEPFAYAEPFAYSYVPYTTSSTVVYPCNAFVSCVASLDGSNAICPGAPAAVSPTTSLQRATCASASTVSVAVSDAQGLAVSDGTPVNFSTTLGYITGQSATRDGEALASLVFHPRTSGVAVITATAGTARTEMTVNVSC